MNTAYERDEAGGIFSSLNEEQFAAVSGRGNLVVSAGAGSGKTTVLASRFIHLVVHRGIPVERILTLTFTRKAAAEMYERIYAKLRTAAQEGRGEVKLRAEAALRDFFRARIQTLDSYCASVVRLAANRYGIRPDFQTDDEGCAQEARRRALRFLLEHRQDPAVRMFLARGSAEEVAYSLFARPMLEWSTVARPAAFEKSLPLLFEKLAREWIGCAQTLTKCSCEIGKYAFELNPDTKFAEDVEFFLDAFFNDPDSSYEFPKWISASDFDRYFTAILDASPEERMERASVLREDFRLILWWSFANAIPKPNRSCKNAEDLNRVLDQCADCREKLDLLSRAIHTAGISAQIAPLLDRFQQEFLGWKRSGGCLSFADVSSLALRILMNEKDVRQSEKEAFDTIMIDEFQDNNREQRDLLYLLAEEGMGDVVPSAKDLCADKLFFVGDEKQSIYRFRGAEVSVFRALRDELGASLSLRTNYRSRSDLITACNLLFAADTNTAIPTVFLRTKNPPSYEASCGPALIPPQCRSGEGAAVSFYLYDKKAGSGDEEESDLIAAESEALCTAQCIHALIEDEKKKGNTLRYADIAILLRSTGKQPYYEKYLRDAGIPYAADNIVGFFSDAPVNDILSLLRLVSYPTDTLSYAALLASPFAGLSSAAVFSVIQSFTQRLASSPGGITVRPFDEEDSEGLSAGDLHCFRAGREVWQELSVLAQKKTLTELVSYLWYEAGYRYETLWSTKTSLYRELYDYLYELARLAELQGAGLASFADSLYSMRESGEKVSDVEIPLDRPDAVRIMTIHKSKGLEFPIVFVCAAGDRIRPDQSSSQLVVSADEGIIAVPTAEIGAAYMAGKKKEEMLRERAELRRLCYVAATRAREKLYIVGSANLSKKDSEAETPEEILSVYVEDELKKQDKKKDADIADNDRVIHNGSCLGLLLPALDRLLHWERSRDLFSLHLIAAHSRKDASHKLRQLSLRSRDEDLESAKGRARDLVSKAEIIDTPPPPPGRITPTSLRETLCESPAGLPPRLDFSAADAVIARLAASPSGSRPVFSAADFGSIVHAHAEAALMKAPLSVPTRIRSLLSESDERVLFEAARSMTAAFLASPLGMRAQAADWLKSEYRFSGRLDQSVHGLFIDGQIDLLFEEGGELCLIDFKTDADIEPARHISQLACYRDAACKLRKRESCLVWLYYLRFNYALDISREAANCAWETLLPSAEASLLAGA